MTQNKNICQKASYLEQDIFTCLTIAGEIPSTDEIKMSWDLIALGATFGTATTTTNKVACSNTDISQCHFSQTIASSPTVTAVTITGTQVTLDGSQFPDSGLFTAKVLIKGQVAEVLSWTSVQIVANFAKGIPACTAAEKVVPRVEFKKTGDSLVFVAYSQNVFVTNTVSVVAADSSSGLLVSFAGGLEYTVTKNNLFATLLEPQNRLEVCGNVCIPNSKSDPTKVVCDLPALASVYSANTYKITQSGVLNGSWTASVPSQIENVKDGNWQSEFTDPVSNCFIEMAFPDGQVGILDSSKILINSVPADKKPFINTLKLQGWDGAVYQTIWTADGEIHDGWNV